MLTCYSLWPKLVAVAGLGLMVEVTNSDEVLCYVVDLERVSEGASTRYLKYILMILDIWLPYSSKGPVPDQ